MSSERRSLKSIFDEAAEIVSPGARAAYLERACGGDADLRRQVEALLRALGEAGSFLEASPDFGAWNATSGNEGRARPGDDPEGTAAMTGGTEEIEPSGAAGSRPSPRPMAEGPGSVIGPYRLLRKIGEGGMGAVFMAEQEHPVRRKVALKVIKPGMDTGQVIARFEAERQALAIMDHPLIARVLDAGATDTGRPYFVMELVDGVSITEFCDRDQLTPKERLELFIPVCRAIQHAHQKGIIHRDIKPTNVLVTLHDGKPMPKVIDFGVAKAIDQRLTEKTMFTEFGAVIGTLEYMSPEQAEMGALDIDTRSDIYSLGVMLYELLTGSTPLERAKLRQAAYSEVLKRIREEETTRPSTRLGESKDSLPSISADRKMEPARLTKLVRGDLDWIVMKSLEKDRTRRYETANGLARDIRRYLDGDPVEACPPSAKYRLEKFARKHRAALTTIGAFAFLLIAATAVSTGLAVWANRERVRAVIAEDEARRQKTRAEEQRARAEEQNARAEGQKTRAEAREQLAIDAVKRFGDVVRESPELLNNPGLAGLRAALLKEPHAFFKRLRDRLQADRETTTDSLARLAAASFELGYLTDEIGDSRDAEGAFEESRAILERLARDNPSTGQFQSDLARALHDIGGQRRRMGRQEEALASFEQSRAIRERLVRDNPSVGRFQRDLAWSHDFIGVVQSETNRHAEALASYEQALAIKERLAREDPSDIPNRSALAQTHHNIGVLKHGTDGPAEALASFEQGRAIRERLAHDDPSVTGFQNDLAWSYDRIGACQDQTGRPAEAMASYEQGRTILERLARDNPSIARFRNDLAWIYEDIGDLQHATDRPEEALASYEKSRALWERLAREHPELPDFAHLLGGVLSHHAMLDLDRQQFDEARAKVMQAIEWQRKALAANPKDPNYRMFLAEHMEILIPVAEGLGRVDEAAEARRELDGLRQSDPTTAALDARLAAVLSGKEAPADERERIRLARRASEKSLHASSARLFALAFADAPQLADDRLARHRYDAACAAAVAASGRGKDDPPPDDSARAGHRRQALEWLQAEIAAWTRILDSGPAELKVKIAPTLRYWKVDSDLAGIRDEEELARLTEAERAAFRQLWIDVDQLLTRAAIGK